jgi:hypothetical protein
LDPFVLTEKDGYFYGRGAIDMKDGDEALAESLIRLKRERFVPERDIIVAFTADEEAGDALSRCQRDSAKVDDDHPLAGREQQCGDQRTHPDVAPGYCLARLAVGIVLHALRGSGDRVARRFTA